MSGRTYVEVALPLTSAEYERLLARKPARMSVGEHLRAKLDMPYEPYGWRKREEGSVVPEERHRHLAAQRRADDFAWSSDCPKCGAGERMHCWNLTERSRQKAVKARTMHVERYRHKTPSPARYAPVEPA